MSKNLLITLVLFSFHSFAQIPEKTFMPQLKSVQLQMYGDQLSYPALRLNGGDRMELHFDDLDANVKNYYYTFQLCNADWTPAMLTAYDFINGFLQQKINNYRISNIALIHYTHYQAILPEANLSPKLSGNYILKVFLDGDTSKLAFTKRFVVYESLVDIATQIQQPFNAQFFRSHQKVQFKVNIKSLQVVNAGQQINIAILQNYRWDNAITDMKPTFMTNNQLEYNTENDAVFPGGKEWRWLDLRSFRFQTDRVDHANYFKNSTEIFVKPDLSRRPQIYYYYHDLNGLYYLQSSENFNPYWQSDYATVHFTFVPSNNIPFRDKDMYLMGQLSNYGQDDSAKMHFNADKGVYETSFILKQGYYSYCYATLDQSGKFTFDDTEGNVWDTENDYMILVYYRSLGGRYDQLVGITKINSITGRPGF